MEEEPRGPAPTPLLTQWGWRPLTGPQVAAEQLTSSYWLGAGAAHKDTGTQGRRDDDII